jgi:glycosyltransferase involved in cell wall biosynthesis
MGRDVRIVAWTGADAFDGLAKAAPGTIVTLGPQDAGGRYTSRDRVLFLFSVFRYLFGRVQRQDRIVTLEDPTALGMAVIPFRLRGIKHYIYVMDLQSVQYLALRQGGRKAMLINRIRQGLDRFTWRLCDAVVVLGDCMKDVVEQIEPRAHVIVLPIWQDGERIHPAKGTAVRRSLGVDDKLVVMYHGHATHRQPLEIILSAAEEMKDNPGFAFVVVGNGPSVDRLEQSAGRRNLANLHVRRRIEDFGFVDVLSSADVHVAVLDERATGTCVPSKTYTSMAVARPCLYVGSQSGQAAIDIRAADCGYVLGTDEHELFVKYLQDLRSSDESRQRMGERGREYFMRERELSVIANRWVELLA